MTTFLREIRRNSRGGAAVAQVVGLRCAGWVLGAARAVVRPVDKRRQRVEGDPESDVGSGCDHR
jgi:hypothetical protein